MSPGSPPQSRCSFQNTFCPPLLPWAPAGPVPGTAGLESPLGTQATTWLRFQGAIGPQPPSPTAWMESQHFVLDTTHDSSDADPGWGFRSAARATGRVSAPLHGNGPGETLKHRCERHVCPSFWGSRCGMRLPTHRPPAVPVLGRRGDSSPWPPSAPRSSRAADPGPEPGLAPRLVALSASQRTHIPQRKPKRPFSSANTRS